MRRTLNLFFGLWLATTIYLLILPTRHLTPDAVSNLMFIEQRNIFELWHSQHILGQWPGYLMFAVTGLRAYQGMEIAQAVLGGLTAALVFASVRRLTRSNGLAVASGLALWLSYGFWHYNGDPDVYSTGYASVALLMLVFIWYLESPSSRRVWLLGLTATFATLTHQMNVEFGVLIGLALIWLAWRGKSIPWRQVVIYAGICAVLIGVGYFLAWQSASAYLTQIGGSSPTFQAPSFQAWAFRYFHEANAGVASWGASLHLNTLPLAGYTFLTSWLLPPLRSGLSPVVIVLLVLLLVGVVLVGLTLIPALPRLSQIEAMVIAVCLGTLLANAISGWWWQVGNVKFYLFMQIHLIVLVAALAHLALAAPQKRLFLAGAGVALAVLAVFQFGLTIPYERSSGIFTIAKLIGDEPASIWFEAPFQARTLRYISSLDTHVLPPDFCASTLPTTIDRQTVVWIVKESEAADCPVLDWAKRVGSFQEDRSRETWGIYAF
jgi:hypothetical protein